MDDGGGRWWRVVALGDEWRWVAVACGDRENKQFSGSSANNRLLTRADGFLI